MIIFYYKKFCLSKHFSVKTSKNLNGAQKVFYNRIIHYMRVYYERV